MSIPGVNNDSHNLEDLATLVNNGYSCSFCLCGRKLTNITTSDKKLFKLNDLLATLRNKTALMCKNTEMSNKSKLEWINTAHDLIDKIDQIDKKNRGCWQKIISFVSHYFLKNNADFKDRARFIRSLKKDNLDKLKENIRHCMDQAAATEAALRDCEAKSRANRSDPQRDGNAKMVIGISVASRLILAIAKAPGWILGVIGLKSSSTAATLPVFQKEESVTTQNLDNVKSIAHVIRDTDQFASYMLTPANEQVSPVKLTGVSIRPSNLFFRALGFKTTMPGEGLFAFKSSSNEIRKEINEKNSQQVVEFSANKLPGKTYMRSSSGEIVVRENVQDLADIYGSNTYRISYGEIQEMLQSQKIYMSSLLPMEFYIAFKKASLLDANSLHDCTLPGDDHYPVTLSTLPLNNVNLIKLYQNVKNNPKAYGFASQQEFNTFSEQTLYQIGSMVVKTEDYRIFADGKGHILERNAGQKDAIRLINACGIRGIHSAATPSKFNKNIMKETFRTALNAAENGISLFPAVGMGIWGGNPDLYWPAFFDAVISSENQLEAICVNPRHRGIWKNKFTRLQSHEVGGLDGNEFQTYFDQYKKNYANDPIALSKLNKIVNLYDQKTDLLQLAYNLKKIFPEKTISIFNASDPDVTLGYHVTEYMNNLLHADTTEENYGALGSSGLLFETITGVHEDPKRLIQT